MAASIRLFKVRSREKGASLVEFAIIAPLLLGLLLVSFDLLRVMYVMLSVQYLSAKVARIVSVGPADRPAAYTTQAGWIRGEMLARAGQFRVPLAADDVQVCGFQHFSKGKCLSGFAGDADVPNELIVIEARVPADHSFLLSAANGVMRRSLRLPPVITMTNNESWTE